MLFAHTGSTTGLLMAWQASEAIETQRSVADLLGLSSNHWTASGLVTLYASCDCAARTTTHDMHNVHDEQGVRFTD